MEHQIEIDEALAIAKEYHLEANETQSYNIYGNNINAT